MPIGLQQLQDFSSVSSVSQLKIDDAGNLSRRSSVGAFFQKVADAFRSLSQSGRAEIMARNTRIADALCRAVKDADAEPPAGENVPALRQRLGEVKNRISAAVQASRQQAGPQDLVNSLHADIRFRNLPENSRQGFLACLGRALSLGKPMRETIDMLSDLFFQHAQRGMNMERGLQRLHDDFTAEFLKPVQQGHVEEDSFHVSFQKDTHRGCISRIGDVITPPNAWEQPHAFYKDALRNLLGEDNARFLPFISMMASQAAMDSMAVLLSIHAENGSYQELVPMGFIPDVDEHSVITREGDDILITNDFTEKFKYMTKDGHTGPEMLQLTGTATMRIHLNQPPREEMVEGKQVVIPQFTFENVAMDYHLPEMPQA